MGRVDERREGLAAKKMDGRRRTRGGGGWIGMADDLKEKVF
jgi:hypothetical protein